MEFEPVSNTFRCLTCGDEWKRYDVDDFIDHLKSIHGVNTNELVVSVHEFRRQYEQGNFLIDVILTNIKGVYATQVHIVKRVNIKKDPDTLIFTLRSKTHREIAP